MSRRPDSPLWSYHGHVTQGSRSRCRPSSHNHASDAAFMTTVRIRTQSENDGQRQTCGHKYLLNTMLPRAVPRGNDPHLTSRLEKAAFLVLLRPIEPAGAGREDYRIGSEEGLR